MFDPQTDPLGIGVMSRARENRFKLAAQGLLPAIGPLPDPQWEGFFQAASEAAHGRPLRFAQDPTTQEMPLSNDPEWRDQIEAANPGQQLPGDFSTRMGSNQIGVGVPSGARASLRRLRKG